MGNFRRVQFSLKVDLYPYVGLIFTDACTQAYYVLYDRAYFTGLIFSVRRKLQKLDPTKISRYMVQLYNKIQAKAMAKLIYQMPFISVEGMHYVDRHFDRALHKLRTN